LSYLPSQILTCHLLSQRADFKYLFTGLQASSLADLARRFIPRVDDQSGFGSLYTSPFVLGRSRWPGYAMDKNSWLWSTKLFSRWSVSVEQSATGNQDDITDTWTVLWPAENSSVSMQLLCVNAAV